jgi:MOSC domain-containing protein YiiM
VSGNPLVIGQVRAVLVGRAAPYTRPGSLSAIDKRPLPGAVAVHAEGLAGDEQGDRRVHGGPDKALHVYPWAHYPAWQAELGALPVLQAPGAFGENLSVDGLDELQVCLGDEWRIGSARFAVSQGRQPCWKLNDRFGVPDMARRVQDSGRSGWYLRVLQPGAVQAGDAIVLLARPHPDWPLARLAALIRERVCAPAALRELLALPLPPSWRRLFERRLDQGQAEDWAPRLHGPARQ